MNRLRAVFARIAIRVPVFMAIVAVMFGTVTATSYLWTKHTSAFLEDLAERDLRTRDIVTKLSAGTEALNTRLLGVMAGVFSSPGSADRIKGFVQTIGAEWTALAAILPHDLKGAEWAEGEEAIKALQVLAPKADAALRASKPLIDVYDSWLDIATPLRKSNQLVTQRLDQHLRDQVQLDLALSAWANKLTIGLMLLSFVLLAFVCWNLIARIARPIGRLTDIMTRVAGGELEIAVPETGRRDEIGHIARAVEVFRESMIRVRTLSESERIESAARERRHKAMEGFTSDFSSAVSGVLGSFSTAANDMREAVGSVLDAAATTRDRMGDVRETSNVSASNLATVASASEEMMASIGEIRRQVERAAEISSGAVVEAGRSSRMVDELAASAQQIGDVVRLIDAVAGQTNLLALNATIEAARAGEAGRGFAVVANEVKGLASQTSKATTEIAERIQRIQGSTTDAAEAIRAVADVVRRVDEIARAIAGTMDEQTMAVQEIVRNVQLASTGTTSAVAVVTEVTATTEVATTAADRVLQAVEGVSAQAGELRAEVQSFLKAMNSAGDRREYARYACSTEVQLEAARLSRRRVKLMDISRSGARIAGELPLAVGETCRLLVAGDDRPVTVRIARRDDESVGVTFQLDDVTSAVVGPILEAAMAAAGQARAA